MCREADGFVLLTPEGGGYFGLAFERYAFDSTSDGRGSSAGRATD